MQGQNPSFLAQYYNSALSLWLSVDPLSDKYPNLSPYTYCADNPVRLVDEDGERINEPDDRPFGRPNFEQNTYNTNPPPAEKSQSHLGWGISLDANLSISAIGYSVEVGYVNDGKGNGSLFFSHGYSVGFEASIGANIFSIVSSDLNLSDFEGKSMSINISSPEAVSCSFITDFSAGAEKDYYSNNYGGLKMGLGIGAGASIAHTKTSLIPLLQGVRTKTASSK